MMKITIEVDSIEKAAELLEAARRLEKEGTRRAIEEAATVLERERGKGGRVFDCKR